MKQFGQEMAELWPKTARAAVARTFMCQKVGDFTCVLRPTTQVLQGREAYAIFSNAMEALGVDTT